MWPIFQHALLMSCHISYSWVVEVCLGFLGFSELLTNWYQSPITVEAAFTAGVFWLFLSPLCFSVCAQTPSLLCSTWAHAASSQSLNFQVLSLSVFMRSRSQSPGDGG